MNTLILSGSARRSAHTDALAVAIQSALTARGAAATVVPLAEAELPPADPTYHRDPAQHPDPRVQRLVQQAHVAEAFVLLSPIYHNSYSAMLKNALDHLAIKQFSGKVVALGSHGGNRTTQAVDHLRIVVRGLNALAIPTQVCTDDTDYTDGGGFVLASDAIIQRVNRLADELIAIGAALRPRERR